jgi:hypothetical protein
MRKIGKWVTRAVALAALLGVSAGTQAASFEDVVPGEMLFDAAVDPYFGKGTEGIAEGAAVAGDVTQNNVDEFETIISPTAGAEQGFVNVFQVSGDNAEVSVFILIDVNINGIEIGGPIAGGEGTFNINASGIGVTATANIESVLDTAVATSGP